MKNNFRFNYGDLFSIILTLLIVGGIHVFNGSFTKWIFEYQFISTLIGAGMGVYLVKTILWIIEKRAIKNDSH